MSDMDCCALCAVLNHIKPVSEILWAKKLKAVRVPWWCWAPNQSFDIGQQPTDCPCILVPLSLISYNLVKVVD